MKPGKINFIFLLFLFNFSSIIFADDKITTIPLVNLENLESSFEKEDIEDKSISNNENIVLKEKKN